MRIFSNKYKVSPAPLRTFMGKVYASRAESARAQLLYAAIGNGDIAEVVEQPRLWLGVRENIYIPDFLVVPSGSGRPYYEDVKGMETPAFKRAKRLWASYGRLDLHIVRYDHRAGRFSVVETLPGSNV